MTRPRGQAVEPEGARRGSTASIGAARTTIRLAFAMTVAYFMGCAALHDDLAFSIATFSCFVLYPIGALASLARGTSTDPVSSLTLPLLTTMGWLVPGARWILDDALGIIISSHFNKIGLPVGLFLSEFWDLKTLAFQAKTSSTLDPLVVGRESGDRGDLKKPWEPPVFVRSSFSRAFSRLSNPPASSRWSFSY